MNSKRLLDMSPAEILVGGASKQAGIDQHAEGSKGRKMTVASTADSGVILACKNGPATGAVFYKFVLDDGSLRECTRQDTVLNVNDLSSGREKYHLLNKVGYITRSKPLHAGRNIFWSNSELVSYSFHPIKLFTLSYIVAEKPTFAFTRNTEPVRSDFSVASSLRKTCSPHIVRPVRLRVSRSEEANFADDVNRLCFQVKI